MEWDAGTPDMVDHIIFKRLLITLSVLFVTLEWKLYKWQIQVEEFMRIAKILKIYIQNSLNGA